VALLHGSFMKQYDLFPDEMLDYSSPIYRAELMMTGRIFAQDAELYADIVFANKERRELLLSFFNHHQALMEMVEKDDKEGSSKSSKPLPISSEVSPPSALTESGYLINRLADRFS
jgi:chorismate mutase / prephenate dehydrogenase